MPRSALTRRGGLSGSLESPASGLGALPAKIITSAWLAVTPEGYRFSQDRHRLAERGRVAYYLRVTGPKEAPRTGNCGTNTDRWNWPQATDQQWVNGPRALTFGRNESALSARAAQTRLQSDYRPLSSKGEAAREPCLSHHPPGRETAPWGVSHRAVPGARQRALMKPAGEPYSTGSITARLLPHVRGAEEFVSVLASAGFRSGDPEWQHGADVRFDLDL